MPPRSCRHWISSSAPTRRSRTWPVRSAVPCGRCCIRLQIGDGSWAAPTARGIPRCACFDSRAAVGATWSAPSRRSSGRLRPNAVLLNPLDSGFAMVIGGEPEGAHRAALDLHRLAYLEVEVGALLRLYPHLAVIQSKNVFAARRLHQSRDFSGQ